MLAKKITGLMIIAISCLSLMACSDNTAQQNYLLGQQYYRAQNYGDAFNVLKIAAKQGNSAAQYALGYMYLNGIGTEVDNATGLNWLKQAAATGQPQAVKALQLLTQPAMPVTP